MNRDLAYSWEDGALVVHRGRNVWRVTGPRAQRLYASARALEAKGKSPGRVLGRLLRGRYQLDREQTERETAAQERARELDTSKSEPVDLEALLRASLVPTSPWYPALPGGPEGRDLDRVQWGKR